jgi:hypothetical protein
MKKIKLGLIVTQESNPVNYFKAVEKTGKRKDLGANKVLDNESFDKLVEDLKGEENG